MDGQFCSAARCGYGLAVARTCDYQIRIKYIPGALFAVPALRLVTRGNEGIEPSI